MLASPRTWGELQTDHLPTHTHAWEERLLRLSIKTLVLAYDVPAHLVEQSCSFTRYGKVNLALTYLMHSRIYKFSKHLNPIG